MGSPFLVKPTVSSVGPEQKSLRTVLVFPCSEAVCAGYGASSRTEVGMSGLRAV